MSGTLSIGDKTVLSHDTNTDVVTLGNATLDSSMTFPAGHVIQTVYKTGTVTNTELSGSNTVVASTFFNKTITAKGNNSIFVIHSFVGKSYAQNTSSYGKVQLTRTINSSTTDLNQLNSGGNWGGIAVAGQQYEPRCYCWVDNTSCSVNDQIDYVIKFVRFNTSGDSFVFIDGSNNGSYCSYVIQEIAA